MKRMKLLGLILGLLISQTAFGQRGTQYPEGYILTAIKDTVWGFVKAGDPFKDQRKIIFFDRFGVRVSYTADRIRGYGYSNNHYISHKLPFLYAGIFSDSVIFLHLIESGPVSLYRFYTRRAALSMSGKPVYTEFLEMPDGAGHEISTRFRWKKIADVFADHTALAAEIRSGNYKPEDIPILVRRYNAWLSDPLRIHE